MSAERIDGLEPRKLLRAALGDAADDPEAVARAAEEEERVRAEVAARLPDLELRELLGRGGMGYVYRAHQRKLDREVALKVVIPDDDKRADFAERFDREAKVLARLAHPNIVAVHDYGREGSFCWLVMEYVDGSNLRDVLRSGQLDPAEALGLVPRICDALQFAHDHGVVHRDVKPENILIDTQGRVKIADFGLAKLVGAPTALVSLTASQQVLGTFRYMAPEQLDRPLEVDHRADIYSLGVVFYEMLTGELPMGRFEPPSARGSTSLEVDDVVLRALETAPERRYQRAAEVKSDLESIGRGERPERRTSGSPQLSIRSVVAAVIFGLAVPLFLPPATLLTTPFEVSGDIRTSLAGIFVLGLLVTSLSLFVVAAVLGWRALGEIRAHWPTRYGVGAAATATCGGLLLVTNVLFLKATYFLLYLPHESTVLAAILATPILIASDAAAIVWYRYRFLRGCRAA